MTKTCEINACCNLKVTIQSYELTTQLSSHMLRNCSNVIGPFRDQPNMK